MNRDEAIALGDRNQVAYFRHLARTASGGRVEEDERFLLFAGGHEYPGTYTNGAIRKSVAISSAELLARADEFFGALGRQYVLWVRAHADPDLDAEAQRRGLAARPPQEGNPCILLTEPLAEVPDPQGYALERAESDSDRRAYLAVVAASWGLAGAEEQLVEALMFSLDSLRADNVEVFVARDRSDGVVRAGISAFLSDSCVGVEWMATDVTARKRGLAAALMLRATSWGFAGGARCAWGMASVEGVPIWQRLGFEVPTRYRRYLVPASAIGPNRSAGPPVRRRARS